MSYFSKLAPNPITFSNERRKSELDSQIPSEVWNQAWIVNCQAVGASENGFKYLAPYVFKVAISNSRIAKVQDRKVFFKYKKPHSNRWRIMALDVMGFLRRFLQHVLPTGFMKIRYYGFMSPGSSVSLEKIATLIEVAFGFAIEAPKTEIEPFKPPTCANCVGCEALCAEQTVNSHHAQRCRRRKASGNNKLVDSSG